MWTFNCPCPCLCPSCSQIVFILLQNIVLVLLIWRLTRKELSARLRATALFAALSILVFRVQALDAVWPAALLRQGLRPQDLMYNVMTLMYVVARAPQIIQNFRQGHTGVVSLLTTVMNSAANAGRVVTR